MSDEAQEPQEAHEPQDERAQTAQSQQPQHAGPQTPQPDPDDDLAGDILARVASAPRRQGTTAPSRRRKSATGQPSFSASGPDVRDPVPAGRAVEELVAAQGWEEGTKVAAAMARWEDIAGPELAAHVKAESFTEGVLMLRADSTAWATQMRLLLPSVRRAIDAAVGSGVVADIRIVGPEPPRTKGAWRVPGRGPRDTYG